MPKQRNIKGACGRKVAMNNSRTNAKGKAIDSKHTMRKTDGLTDIYAKDVNLNIDWFNPAFNINSYINSADFEKQVYEKAFKEYIDSVNEKAIKSRHEERKTDGEKLIKSHKTGVEETLFYLGNKDEKHIDPALFNSVMQDYINAMRSKYPRYLILGYSIHYDEAGAPHCHLRACYMGINKDGLNYPNQSTALKAMGYEAKRDKYDNEKVKFTKDCRTLFENIAMQHGIKIDINHNQSKGGLSLLEYKIEQNERIIEEQRKQLMDRKEVDKVINATRPNRFNKDEVLIKKADLEQLAYSAGIGKRIEEENIKLRKENNNWFDISHNSGLDIAEINNARTVKQQEKKIEEQQHEIDLLKQQLKNKEQEIGRLQKAIEPLIQWVQDNFNINIMQSFNAIVQQFHADKEQREKNFIEEQKKRQYAMTDEFKRLFGLEHGQQEKEHDEQEHEHIRMR